MKKKTTTNIKNDEKVDEKLNDKNEEPKQAVVETIHDTKPVNEEPAPAPMVDATDLRILRQFEELITQHHILNSNYDFKKREIIFKIEQLIDKKNQFLTLAFIKLGIPETETHNYLYDINTGRVVKRQLPQNQ